MLTDLAIRSLPLPEKGVKRYWDKDGLCLQVSQGGTKTFYFVHGENQKYLKLGRYPEPLSLSQAREKVRAIIAKKTLGITEDVEDTKLQVAITHTSWPSHHQQAEDARREETRPRLPQAAWEAPHRRGDDPRVADPH